MYHNNSLICLLRIDLQGAIRMFQLFNRKYQIYEMIEDKL